MNNSFFNLSGDIKIELGEETFRLNMIIGLLSAIKQTGSIAEAAKETGISYSFAWRNIFKLNCLMGIPIVVPQRGGKGGGVSTITKDGEKLLLQLESISNNFNRFLENNTPEGHLRLSS